MKEKRIEAFTGSGTFTVPAGVTYAIAHMLGGGAGSGTTDTASDGNPSSVAFSSGTVTGPGLRFVPGDIGGTARSGANNTGQSASLTRGGNAGTGSLTNVYNVAGASVTPGASITVTVGAGGAAGSGGAAGGSGYVYIEFFEEV